jgi:hypothetical protein
MPARRVPAAARILFVVALLFTAIGCLETLFIAYDAVTGGSLSAERYPDLAFGIRSWELHHELRPGYVSPNVHTNSLGLRSPEVAIPKPAGTRRVLLLGDSFTFGFQVSDADVFARALEAGLRKRFPAASIEVVNAGVVSYCPLLEYLQYRDRLHILEPDLVVLNFDMSDVQDHLAYSRNLARGPDGSPLYVTEPSLGEPPGARAGLLSFWWIGAKISSLRQRWQSARADEPFYRDQDRYLWALDGGPDMTAYAQQTLAPVLDLARLLDHHHIPLMLATYPQPWQVSADATPLPPIRDQYGIGRNTVHLNDRPFRLLAEFAASHALPFVNATPAFRQDGQPATLFLQSDFHFTPRGNALYASVLENAIVSSGLLHVEPASGSIR